MNKKIIFSLLGSTLGIGVGMSILPMTNLFKSNLINKISDNQQADSTEIKVPTETNDQNANLSTNTGPVTFLGNTVTALDWYGEKLWSIDFANEVPDKDGVKPGKTYNGSWPRAWLNWDYNRTTNEIWILGAYSEKNKTQPLFCVNAATGVIKSSSNISYSSLSISVPNASSAYRFISALSSGKVMVYGGAGSTYDAKAILYDPSTNTNTKINGNSSSTSVLPMGNTQFGTNYKWYFYNLIPVANNKNLVEVVSFSNQSTTDDTVAGKNATYDIYVLLVDDNLNMVTTFGTWASKVKVADHLVGYRNTQITPQRDYYTMLNGRVVTVVYNTVIVFDPTDTNNIKYASFPMTDTKWIKSWSFDSNENLYFKFKNESKIYKLSGDNWKTINNSTSESISPLTYLELSSVTQDDVQKYANNFIIYNVYGYTGQLMLLNSKYNSYVNTSNANLTTTNTDSYGLAIAVTQNANNQAQGDYKGALNGPNSFQKSADFKLSENAISSKIPSEITSSDIEFLNNGFFKSNDVSSFIVKSIDDVNGKISITCNLYQIPWFSTLLPDNVTPKTITHDYVTTNKIANKTSWKELTSSTNYDFLNMLPSKVQVSDIENADPFQVSFQSQTITNSEGAQLYPKKTYSVGTTNDTNGTIEVKIKYEYIPMSTTYTNSSDVKTYESSHTYSIFKSSDTAQFRFAGQTASSTNSLDVNTVPELSALTEANVLPSSFSNISNSDSTNSSYLQFINTTTSKGYPISKMKFELTPNDNNGTLKIVATMPQNYSPNNKEETFTMTYSGLNKISSYNFSFKDNTTINETNKNELLPSSITKGNIINELITYKGFNSNDFSITLTPNDIDGTLEVSISLSSNYASNIGSSGHGFTNYIATHRFSGFMTTESYNSRYAVSLIDDSSEKLIDLKQKQASEIYDSLVSTSGANPKGLTIGNTTYTNLKDLIDNLLVDKKGALIPSDWKTNSSIIATMYVDNSLGTISFYITIPKSQMTGANSDLNIAATYTGFVKGNAVSTDDNLSFIPDNMLENYLVSSKYVTKEQFNNFTPTTFASWLQENNNDNALKLISYKTGQYETYLNSKTNYTLSIIPNENQGNVTITIHFDKITNTNSLTEYSMQYTI